MRNDKRTSATRLFSMIKNKPSFTSINFSDKKNQIVENSKNEKEDKDRGEFLKRLIQTDEDNNQENQQNYNVYSKPTLIYLNNKNDSYRNSIKEESEKLKNTNSILASKKSNSNLNKESDDSEEKNLYYSEEKKKYKNKKKKSISSKKRNTHTILIRNKSTKNSLFNKMTETDKLKNHTVFTKYKIGNISGDEREVVQDKNNIFNTLKNNINNLVNDDIKDNNNYNNLNKKDSFKTSENKNNEKLEYLKVGDIVILINILTNDLSETNIEEKNIVNDGIVYPEIIVSKQLFCLPLSKLNDSHRSKGLFKRSLFRIENPQNFAQQYQYEALKNTYKSKNNEDINSLGIKEQNYLKLLSKKALEEKKHNESEFLLNYNKKILFGTVIQLRNIFTNELLTVDLGYLSKEIGCLDVVLNSLGGENSQFIFAPSNCLRNYGDPIFYNETFHIIPCCLENNHYIHIKDTEDVKGNGYELNVSRNESIFKLLLFESAEINRKSSIKNEIKSTMVVKLYNINFNGFLSASIFNINKILPKLKTNQKSKNTPLIEMYNSYESSNSLSSNDEENEEEEIIEKNIIKNTKINKNFKSAKTENFGNKNRVINNNNFKRNKSQVFLNKSNSNISSETNYSQEIYYKIILDTNNQSTQDDCLSYWEIQYEKPFEGKIINSECPIRFRHISSGLYLSFDVQKKEISLKQFLNDDSIFYIYNENLEKNIKKSSLISGDQIYLRAKNTNMYLKICKNKKDNKSYNLSLEEENKMRHEYFAFKIELQNNSLIQINYNANLIINHLINLYEQINYWGVKEAEGVDLTKVLMYDYYTALQGELNFKKMVDFYRSILIFINNESQKAMNDINVYINFQNYHTSQGLIFLLLNFILLFDSKILDNKDEKRGKFLDYKEKASPENIARKHIGDVIELTFNLLKMLIKNNKESSKNIFHYLFLFDELLNNHLLETIEIFVIFLKNTFSQSFNQSNNINYSDNFVSPNEENENMRRYDILTSTQYWIKKIKEIDEINNNILEQIIFIKVLKRLCLDADGSRILRSQMEIANDLYRNDLHPLKFGIDNNSNKPYVIFNVKDSNDEFFLQNPSLNDIKIENNNTSNIPMFYYTSFSDKHNIFINYICAVLNLYYASCFERNETNINIMIDSKNVGLTLQHIFLVITDNNIDVKIRKIYSKLYQVLFIDSSSRERISKNRMKIFLWNSELNEGEDILQNMYGCVVKDTKDNKKARGGKNNQALKTNDSFYLLRYYINNFFNDKDYFQNLIDKNEDINRRLKFYKFLGFLEEVLILTRESLDFGLWILKDLIILIQNINAFFIVFKYYRKKIKILKNETELYNYNDNINIEKNDENEIKKLIQNNWLAKLVYCCMKSKYPKIKNRLYQIYDKILDIYNIIIIIKEDSEKYMLLTEFKKWYNTGECLLNNTQMIKLYNNFNKWENSLKFSFNNEINNEKDYEILNDHYLFEILFSSELNNELTEYQLFNKSFSMMINHINNQNDFIKELNKAEIIVNDEDLKIYELLIGTNRFIQKKKQNIEAVQISKNNPIEVFKNNDRNTLFYDAKIRNNKNRDIATILDDLTNKLDADLIQKMKLQSNNKLNKIQNLCQILQIHKYLIDLLQFLLNYENKTNLYDKIFQFLFHFCYKNHINQKLLKSYFDFFLGLMPRFKYIGDVLMEILNLYRETKKSQKYITKIFGQIKEFDLVCPEIIEILISLMFNNKKENLSENQTIILQNFFYILKNNAFKEFLEESKIIEYIDCIKSHSGDYFLIDNEFKSYLNIFEIISYSCINNKYCILNCRQMLSIEELVNILKSYNYPYKLKTFLLLFFKNVYYPFPTFSDIKLYDIKFFFDIMENLILKELILFYFYSVFFIERYLEKKGIEPNDEIIRGNPNCSSAYSLIINQIKNEPEIKDYLILQKINLDSLENTKSLFGKNKFISNNKNEEYMNFFVLIRQNSYFEVQGLISFLYHMYVYIKENKIELNQHQKDIILLCKKRLNKIENFLEKIENELILDTFITDIEYHIQKCLSIFIYDFNDFFYSKPTNMEVMNKKNLNEDELQKIEQNAQKLLECLNGYILLNETNLLRIFNLSENENNNEIDKFQFRRTMKLLLNNHTNNEEIEDTINFLDKKESGIIVLKDLTIYLNRKRKKNKRNIGDKKDQNISEYLNLNSKLDDKSFKISFTFKEYLFLFQLIQKQIGYNNVLKSIIGLINSENNIGNLILFFSRILGYFNKIGDNKKQKLSFLILIHEIIRDKINNKNEKNIQLKREKIQVTKLIFCHSGIIEFVLKNLNNNNDNKIIYECFCILILCLTKGNKNVQNTIYNYVSYKNNTYKFLSCLGKIISESFNNIKAKNISLINNNVIMNNYDYEMIYHLNSNLNVNEINILNELYPEKFSKLLMSKILAYNYKLPIIALLFIKLCCENNENFQNFFRDSEFDKNIDCNPNENIIINDNIKSKEIGTINLVNDISTLLINLLNLGVSIYYNYDIWKLTKEVFSTLTHLCEGPCEKNQITLGLRKTIFSSINFILQRDYNLQVKDEINTRKNLLMCHCINFLKSLISEKSLKHIGEIFLQATDIYLLIEKLIDIYSFIIKPNENLLYKGEICQHIKKENKKYKEMSLNETKNNLKDKKCEKNICKFNYVSINEMEFINTGFNIFIILIYLKDMFPNHQKLSLFDLNLKKTKNSQFLKMNQIKERNQKEYFSKEIHINKKEFNDYFQNNLLLRNNNISEIDIDNSIFNNSFENENDTRKALEFNEFFNSDINLQEISVLEENLCSKFLRWLTCGFYKTNKKSINKKNKSFELPKNQQFYSCISTNNSSLSNLTQANNEITNLNKRFISKYKNLFNDAYIFYSKHTSSVEISIKDLKYRKYFKIPFIFIYLTNDLRLRIINAWKSTVHQSSLREILNNIDRIIAILNHKQKLRKYHILIENLRPIEIISYILTIIFNLILIIFTTNNDIENCPNDKRSFCSYISSSNNKEIKYTYLYEIIEYIINIIMYMKLFLYVLIFILTIIKRYIIIKNNMNNKADTLIEEYKERKMKKYEGSLLYHVLNDINKSAINSYNYLLISLYKTKGLNIIFDFDVILLLIDITISVLSIFISPFLQVLCLFDIIRLNSFLFNIIYILFKQISKFFFMIYMLLIVIFIFSVAEFMLMRDYYYSNDYMNILDNDINLYCDTIYYCFISILHYGINPNNILLVGGTIKRSDSSFYLKLVIDLFLFCITFSIIGSIFLGVVINSLREFKEIMNEKQKTIKERCFICGLPKYKLDRQEKGWIYHYKREHNVFSYIYFLVDLKNKNLEACDGIEKYVKKCIEKEDLIFLPIKK